MKRIFSLFLALVILVTFIISLTISASAASEPEELEFYNFGYTYGVLRAAESSTVSSWTYSNVYDNLPWSTSKGLQLVSPGILYVRSFDYLKDLKFERFYTYQISYSLRTTDTLDISSWGVYNICTGSLAGFNNAKSNGFYTGTNWTTLNQVFDYSSVFVSNSYDSNYITLDIIINVTSETDFYYISPMFYYQNTSGETVKGVYLQLDSVTGVRDYNQEIYQETTSKLQQEIKQSIDSGFKDVNNNLNDIENVLKDDPNHTPDTSPLKDDLSELEDLEGDINDSITKPIKLPDGSTIQVDANTLLNLKSWYKEFYNAPEYDANAGKVYAKIFEAFMPYLGTTIFFSLLLGLIIAFLTGKRSV